MSTRPCVLTQPLIQRIRAVKLLQYVIANLNLKGFRFFYTHCSVRCTFVSFSSLVTRKTNIQRVEYFLSRMNISSTCAHSKSYHLSL